MANKKKCRYCGTYVNPDEALKVSLGVFCNTTCSSSYWLEKDRKKQEKAYKERTKQFAKERGVQTTKKNQMQLTQDEYNRWIKLEEIYRCKKAGVQPECISCGKVWTESNNHDFACGHYKTRGARSDLAMDTRNTWLQCNKRCNSELSGNITGQMGTRGYTRGLMDKLGDEFEAVSAYLDRVRIARKYTDDEYKNLRKWLAARNRELRKLI